MNVAAAPTRKMSSNASFPPESIRRHSFLRVAPECVGTLTIQQVPALPCDTDTILRDWLGAGRPLVIRRPCLSEEGTVIYAGIATPPAMGKLRLPLEVPSSAVAAISPPPGIEECDSLLQQTLAWERGIAGLREAGLRLRVFGSHAWQHLTGLAFISPASDIDLLLNVDSGDQLRAALHLLQAFDFGQMPRVDLEIVLRGDASFMWREFCNNASSILIKGNHTVWMETKDKVLAYD